MTFWLEHNGGMNYDTSHLIESIERRNLNKPSAFKYVTKLLKFTSIWLDDCIIHSSTTMTEATAYV